MNEHVTDTYLNRWLCNNNWCWHNSGSSRRRSGNLQLWSSGVDERCRRRQWAETGRPLIISYGTTYVLSYPYNRLALQKERGCLTDLIQWLMELLLISLSARSRLVRVPSNSPTVSVFSRSSSDDFTPESCRFQLSRPELNILTLFRFLVPSVFLCFRLFLLYFLSPWILLSFLSLVSPFFLIIRPICVSPSTVLFLPSFLGVSILRCYDFVFALSLAVLLPRLAVSSLVLFLF